MPGSNFHQKLVQRRAFARRSSNDLHEYQSELAIPFLMDNPFSAAFMDMGLGKTVAILTVLQRLFTRGRINKVLIIAPLRVAVQTWPLELKEWSHTWWMTYTLIRANERHPGLLDAQAAARKANPLASNHAAGKAKTAHIELQRRELASRPSMIHIINREGVDWLVKFHGKNWPYDTVIVDESKNFADKNAARWKALNKVRAFITRMHLLSGVPAPEGIENYFAQIYLLDRGERFGRSLTAFRENYMIHQPWQHRWIPRDGAPLQVANKIKDLCIVMREEDFLKRDKAIVIERPILLEPEELQAYEDFERSMILDLPEVEIEAKNGGSLAGKLLQMASGAVYDEIGKWHHIHDHKLEELKELVAEAQGSPLLVAYWHRSSLERLQKAFPKAIKMDREGRCVKPWNEGKIKMLLVHPRSAGHGLNMQHGPGHILIWFDNPMPLDDYLQMNKRLDRPGQKKIVRVYHLVARDTVDATVVPVLRGKDDAQDAVKKYIRDLRGKWK
jgi:SNF2 family DNA or RNA helicase